RCDCRGSGKPPLGARATARARGACLRRDAGGLGRRLFGFDDPCRRAELYGRFLASRHAHEFRGRLATYRGQQLSEHSPGCGPHLAAAVAGAAWLRRARCDCRRRWLPRNGRPTRPHRSTCPGEALMMESTAMKVALVTGANKGIGLETARQLAQQGFTVLLGSRDETRGRQAAERLKAEGLATEPVKLDVT